jgi:hypothetical protein
MDKYVKVDTVDFDDTRGAKRGLLWAKSGSACGASLTVTWDAGGIQAPHCNLEALQRRPPALAVLHHSERRTQGWIYDKAIARPTHSIWNCNPKNVVGYGASRELNSRVAWLPTRWARSTARRVHPAAAHVA